MSARSALTRRLAGSVPSVDGRVFEMAAAMPTTEYPFLVVKGSAEDPGEAWADVDWPFEVWPYAAPVTTMFELTPYGVLDQVVAEIRAALGGKGGYWYVDDAKPYVMQWLGGSSDDFQDEAWNGAHTRPQRVMVSSLDWLVLNHPILEALRIFVAEQFSTWDSNPSDAPPTDISPWVFWRFISVPVPGEALTLDLDWSMATIAGHVVAPDAMARALDVSALAHALQFAGDSEPPVIRLADGSWMQINSVRANPDADPRSTGQIQMEVQFIASDDLLKMESGSPGGSPFGRAVLYGPPTHVSQAPPIAGGEEPAPTGRLIHQ